MPLTTIRRYRDLSEAIVARSLLESSGIRAHLCDENLVRMEWQISNFIGGIRLQVEDEDEQEAIEILDAPIPDVIDYDAAESAYDQPRCSRAGQLTSPSKVPRARLRLHRFGRWRSHSQPAPRRGHAEVAGITGRPVSELQRIRCL